MAKKKNKTKLSEIMSARGFGPGWYMELTKVSFPSAYRTMSGERKPSIEEANLVSKKLGLKTEEVFPQ